MNFNFHFVQGSTPRMSPMPLTRCQLGMLLTLVVCSQSAVALADDVGLSQPRSVYRPTHLSEQPVAAPAQAVAAPATQTTPAVQPLPLSPPREKAGRDLVAPRMPGDRSTVTTICTSLAVVLGLFFLCAWFLRRNMPKGMSLLPSEVVEQLGRAPLAGKQNMHLVRVGQKLLLIAVTPFGTETLTEVTDPDEVARLCGLCRSNSKHGPTAEFRAALRQFEREPAGPGFFGDTTRSDMELANAGRTRGRERLRGPIDA